MSFYLALRVVQTLAVACVQPFSSWFKTLEQFVHTFAVVFFSETWNTCYLCSLVAVGSDPWSCLCAVLPYLVENLGVACVKPYST